MTRQIAAMTAALTLLSTTLSFAQIAKLTTHKPNTPAKGVYVCKDCHQYFTPMQAKKLRYKDPDGGRLVKVSNVPAGYSPGLKTKM